MKLATTNGDLSKVVAVNATQANKASTPVTGSRVKSLKKKVVNDRINKLESVPFKIENEAIKQVLKDSDFLRMRAVLGSKLSLYGKACVGIIPYKDTYLLDAMDVISVDMIGRFEQQVIASSGALEIYNNVSYPVYTKYYFNEAGKATLTRFITTREVPTDKDTKDVTIGEPHVFDCDELPVEVFLNNHEIVDDFTYAGVLEDLERLQVLDDEYMAQYHLSKNAPFFNTSFTSNDPSAETNALKKGRGYYQEKGINATLGAGTQMIPMNTSMQQVAFNIGFLEDDLYKKLGIRRDIVGGNNKHTIEVITSDETTLETNESIRVRREMHYRQLLNKLACVIGTAEVEVELMLSIVEQAKWRFFEAQISGEEAKAVNVEEPTEEEPTEEVPEDEEEEIVEDEEVVEEETEEEVVAEEDKESESDDEESEDKEEPVEEDKDKEEEA